MRNLTLTQDYIQELSAKTGFKDNGDVDFQNSVLYVDDNDSIVAAIVVGNITHVPALGKALPENVKDEKGSALRRTETVPGADAQQQGAEPRAQSRLRLEQCRRGASESVRGTGRTAGGDARRRHDRGGSGGSALCDRERHTASGA